MGDLQAIEGGLLVDEENGDDCLEDSETEDSESEVVEMMEVETSTVTSAQSSDQLCTSPERENLSITMTESEINRRRLHISLGRALYNIVHSKSLVIQYDSCQWKAKQIKKSNIKDRRLEAECTILSNRIKNKVLDVFKTNSVEVKRFSTSSPNISYRDFPDSIKTTQHTANMCKKILTSEWKDTMED